MKQCKKCERLLFDDEKCLCPACKSDRDFVHKRILAFLIVIAISVAIYNTF